MASLRIAHTLSPARNAEVAPAKVRATNRTRNVITFCAIWFVFAVLAAGVVKRRSAGMNVEQHAACAVP